MQSTVAAYSEPYECSPSLDPILNRVTIVHALKPCFLKICFNTVLLTTHRFIMLSLPFRSLDYAPPSLTFIPIPWPPHSTWLGH